jgi:prepilin-type N-terminal cleavage/methylation domain-containing protein
MTSGQRAKYGFTLIEALVAVVILAIGIVGTMAGYQNLSRIESRSQQSELLQRLAYEKYDEEIATPQAQLAATSGDFGDRNLTGYTWALTVDPTSVTDLMAVTVTVTKDSDAGRSGGAKGVARGLYYQQQATAGGGATP